MHKSTLQKVTVNIKDSLNQRAIALYSYPIHPSARNSVLAISSTFTMRGLLSLPDIYPSTLNGKGRATIATKIQKDTCQNMLNSLYAPRHFSNLPLPIILLPNFPAIGPVY